MLKISSKPFQEQCLPLPFNLILWYSTTNISLQVRALIVPSPTPQRKMFSSHISLYLSYQAYFRSSRIRITSRHHNCTRILDGEERRRESRLDREGKKKGRKEAPHISSASRALSRTDPWRRYWSITLHSNIIIIDWYSTSSIVQRRMPECYQLSLRTYQQTRQSLRLRYEINPFNSDLILNIDGGWHWRRQIQIASGSGWTGTVLWLVVCCAVYLSIYLSSSF